MKRMGVVACGATSAAFLNGCDGNGNQVYRLEKFKLIAFDFTGLDFNSAPNRQAKREE